MGVEPTFSPWKGDIIAVIRRPHFTPAPSLIRQLADRFLSSPLWGSDFPTRGKMDFCFAEIVSQLLNEARTYFERNSD